MKRRRDDAFSFLERWLPSTHFFDQVMTSIDLSKVMKDMMDREPMKELVSIYIDALQSVSSCQAINFDIPDDALASGVVFFYSCLLYVSNFERWQEYIRDVASFVMLYVLVDHYLDEFVDTQDNKSSLVFQMGILVFQPELIIQNQSPFLREITHIYSSLIQRCPQVRSPMIDLFMIETKSWRSQRDVYSKKEDLFRLAKEKGGRTVVVLQKLMNQHDDETLRSTMIVGGVCQLIDDCLDVHLDRKNKIVTVATQSDKLDELWIETVEMLKEIKSFGNLVWFLSTMMILLPCVMHLDFSEEFMKVYPYSKLEGSYRFDHEMRNMFQNLIKKIRRG